MKKEEFLSQLRNKLKKLPPEEVNDALEFYEEYLDDAGEENEEAAIAELGTPGQVASQIMAQYAVKQMTVNPSAQKGLSTIWIVLLAIFASPIAVPIAVALAAVVLAMVVVVISIVAAFGTAAVALSLSGLFSFFIGFTLLFQSIQTALFYIGCGLFLAGAGTALFLFVVWVSKKGFGEIAKLFSKLLPRRKAL